ncbi:hypothetical protein SAMN04490192_2867 [Pseudomonas lundensis]|uniref:hypothetical protein n=1 Tax=Pseudomonas lundensis TaxID=86185 RepID=UPI000892242E|nr:hypothetical protein [Pseudomonas lundensis]SDQ71743.1 hypothetical protein SAMN04490192_2867 [Pseudomonas lundensis]
MAIPPLAPLPVPPLATDSEVVFNAKADATLLAEKQFVDQMNATTIPGINAASSQVAADALFAGQAADRAEAVDTNVSEQVAAAQVAAASAAASATAAESAQGSLGNLALMYAIALAS